MTDGAVFRIPPPALNEMKTTFAFDTLASDEPHLQWEMTFHAHDLLPHVVIVTVVHDAARGTYYVVPFRSFGTNNVNQFDMTS